MTTTNELSGLALRRRVLELAGWTAINDDNGFMTGIDPKDGGRGILPRVELNLQSFAAHIDLAIESRGLEQRFTETLLEMIHDERPVYKPHLTLYYLLTASAEQRCRAWVRVMENTK